MLQQRLIEERKDEDMDNLQREQEERNMKKTQEGIESQIARAIEEIDGVDSRLEVIATVLPGTKPLDKERHLMQAARRKIRSLPAEIEKALRLTEALAKG